jgi:hypothetical protein
MHVRCGLPTIIEPIVTTLDYHFGRAQVPSDIGSDGFDKGCISRKKLRRYLMLRYKFFSPRVMDRCHFMIFLMKTAREKKKANTPKDHQDRQSQQEKVQ